MTPRYSELSDEELGRRLAGELPRHSAPAHLARAVRGSVPQRTARPAWLAPSVAALATALLLVLGFVPMLPRFVPLDPTERLVRAVVNEHTRMVMWGSRRGDVVLATLPELSRETGLNLNRAFIGDDQLALVAAEPVYVDSRRGIAIHYRDPDGHLVSYIAVPAEGVRVPDARRVLIDRWRPALMRDSGYAAWVWRQGEVACLIVSDRISDAEMETFKEYFKRLRTSTEPLPAY
jgi:anti-sigma factor RsiW